MCSPFWPILVSLSRGSSTTTSTSQLTNRSTNRPTNRPFFSSPIERRQRRELMEWTERERVGNNSSHHARPSYLCEAPIPFEMLFSFSLSFHVQMRDCASWWSFRCFILYTFDISFRCHYVLFGCLAIQSSPTLFKCVYARPFMLYIIYIILSFIYNPSRPKNVAAPVRNSIWTKRRWWASPQNCISLVRLVWSCSSFPPFH